jgi:hypothetical protein
MAWMPNGVGRCARARLQIEPLEERSLLTIAGFQMNLYADSGGVPGQPIPADTVEVGDSFFVEITAKDQREDATGLAGHSPGIRGLALDIAWNPQVFEEIDNPFDPASGIVTENFPLFRDGKLDNGAGRIDDLQGAMSLSSAAGELIGDDGPERFALLRFRALEAVGDSTLSMNLGLRQISMFPSVPFIQGSDFEFESQIITVAEPTDLPVARTTSPPDVQVNVYQGTGGAAATLIASDAVDPAASFFVEIILEPPTVASQPTGSASIDAAADTNVWIATDEPTGTTSALARLDVASLAPFADGAIDLAAGELLVTQVVVDVHDVAVDLPLAAGPVDGARFVVQETRRIGLSYSPQKPEAAAADAVFAAAPTERPVFAADVRVDHALLQALASGLAAAANEDKTSDPFGANPI